MNSSDIPHASPHPEVVPGVIIGPWLIRERFDKGSFGVVFKVTRAGHPEAGPFALKLAIQQEDPRFQREVALLKSIQHPNVPRFEDRGWWRSARGRQYPYVVMEWVEGEPLYRWAGRRPRTSRQVLQVLSQLGSALAAAHAGGGLHRDVKGDNVLVTGAGRAVLLDWGCAVHCGAKVLTDGPLGPGTTTYRSPEALRWSWAHRKDGERYEAVPPDDVYALGVTAYRMCTGTYPPMPTEGPGSQRRLLPASELATVSRSLERLMFECLAQERFRRPPAAALSVALAGAAEEEEARVPIILMPAAAPTSPGSPRWRWRWTWRLPRWAPVALAALGGGLAVGAFLLATFRICIALSEPSWEPRAQLQRPGPEAPDGGVGEEALASVVQVPRAAVPAYAIGLPPPKRPFPGQRKPPCDPDTQRAILGACWVGPISTKKPPCGAAAFDFDDGCYVPVFDAPRAPASEDPQ